MNVIAILKRSRFWILVLSLAFLGYALVHPNVYRGPRSAKRIALTLDDGPNPPYTSLFLRLLAQEKIPATFFVLGRNIELHRKAALEIVSQGHEIGNHSYSHQPLAWKSPHLIAREISRTDALIRSLGYQGKIPFRAPFGEWFGMHNLTLFWLGRENVLYDVPPEPPDYFRSNPQAMADSAQQRVKPGSIVLFHDGEGIRVESLEATARLIPALKRQGYTFVRVSEL